MIYRLRTVLFAALSSLLGIVLGIVAAAWFYGAFMSSGLFVKHEADLVTRVAVLEDLRAGRIADATLVVETLLDADLIAVAALSREGDRLSTNARRAVAAARRSRAMSGYKSADPQVAVSVDDAISRLLKSAE